MRILVTGGNGFLGSHIVKKLLYEGHDVHSLARSPQPQIKNLGAKIIQGDLCNFKTVDQATTNIDAVFHVAAKAGIWGDWKSYFKPNVIGTRNIINSCKKNKVKHLIYTSTPSVIFNSKAIKNGDESMPYGSNWLCHYAHTKALAEKDVLEANSSRGLKTIALRPHLIWGPGDSHLIPRIIEKAKTKKLKIIGSGQNEVDITYIDNAVDAHLLALYALENEIGAGNAYFISQGKPVNLWNWINQLLEKIELPTIKKAVSFNLGYSIGALCEFAYKILNIKNDPPMTRFVATELAKDHYFNINQAKTDLGYTPKVSTEEGLKRLVEYLGITDQTLF